MDFLWHILFTIGNWLPGILVYSLILGRGRVMHWGIIGGSLVAVYALYLPISWGYGYLPSLLIGLAGSCGISLLYAWLAVRLPDDAFGVMSIAVHLILLTIVLNWSSLTRGARGIPAIERLPGLEHLSTLALVMAGIAVLWLIVMLYIDKSALGRQLTALGEHRLHAGALGVHRGRVYVAVFLLTGAALWTSNFFYPQYLHLLYPTDYFFPTFIFALTIVVAGRPGSVWGVTLATILLVLLRESMRFLPLPADMLGPLRLIVFGMILFAAVWVRREQLFPRPRTV